MARIAALPLQHWVWLRTLFSDSRFRSARMWISVCVMGTGIRYVISGPITQTAGLDVVTRYVWGWLLLLTALLSLITLFYHRWSLLGRTAAVLLAAASGAFAYDSINVSFGNAWVLSTMSIAMLLEAAGDAIVYKRVSD